MKIVAWIAGLLGLALITVLIVRSGFDDIVHAIAQAGWGLLWVVPYRLLYFVLYSLGWQILLRPHDPQRRAGLGYLTWVATVREGIDRLLPVAGVGGGVVGVRMIVWRGIAGPAAAASVIVEILLTLINLYLFTALGLLLVLMLTQPDAAFDRLLLGFALSLPVPIVMVLLLRYGAVFERLQGFLKSLLGDRGEILGDDPAVLDRMIRSFYARKRELFAAGCWQFVALTMGALEVWFALRLLGHPVSIWSALAIESMTQAVRHFAFFVPAGLGVQEAGLVLFGNLLGLPMELALSLSLVKRMRELVCGVPPLIGWQWQEGQRLLRARRAVP